ncbi:MAG: DEAD/DEAH box helicase, partial [Spirochaetaceae bacterium]|nr:DEAD/DEAH box helicase [Spirochaetaceae bacterium]
MRRDIKEKRSTLAFIDSRKWSEKLARLINEGEEEVLAWAHHGSLSKDMRRLVEKRLKEGRLKAVVATGSLELGIDIGPLDEVIMLGSPASPSVTLQRAGRAGHKPDIPSRARIYPITPGDLLAGTVLAKMAEEGDIEEIRIPENPLDMLAQTILALCAERSRKEKELWLLIRRVWSFRNLPRASFDSVLAMLRGRYAETRIAALKPRLYIDGNRLYARPGTRMLLYSGGGAIPDLGMYSVREQGGKTVLGSLDEKFVWESQPGAVFHLGNRRWRVIGINDREVIVTATDEAVNTEPFWRADSRNRDEEYARRIAELLEDAEKILTDSGMSGDTGSSRTLEDYLTAEWHLEPEQAIELSEYLRSQRRRGGGTLPHRHHIVAEAASDPDAGGEPGARTLFIHTMLGGRVNRPLALALQAAWA